MNDKAPTKTNLRWMLAMVLFLPACGKENLDKHVDTLVDALQRNDYEAFELIAHPGLLETFPAKRFSNLSKGISFLGEFRERTMHGIKTESGGYREGRYTLDFAQGSVELEIKLLENKMVSFAFSGEPIEAAIEKARNERFKEFKVMEFRFLDEGGTPKNNSYAPGKPIPFRVGVQGLARRENTLRVRADLRLVDAAGTVVMQKAGFIDASLDLEPDAPPVATLSGTLRIPRKGNFTVRLLISDVNDGGELVHEETVTVE